MKTCPECGVNLIRDDKPYCQVCWMIGSYYQHELWVPTERWFEDEDEMNRWFKAGLKYFKRGIDFYGLYDLWFNYWTHWPGEPYWGCTSL